MKQCVYCNNYYEITNFSKHLDKCIVKLKFNATFSEIIDALSNNCHCDFSLQKFSYEQKIKDLEYQICLNIENVRKILNISQEITSNYDQHTIISPQYIINELPVSELTRKSYATEWSSYSKWCGNQHNLLNKTTVNQYLSDQLVYKKVSTVKKKRSCLQHILRTACDNQNISVNRIRIRNNIKSKNYLTKSNFSPYFKEQKKFGMMNYCIQKLQYLLGCRINALSNLKVEHINFQKKTIIVPDSKTGDYKRKITHTISILLNLIAKIKQKKIKVFDEFILPCKHQNPYKRSIFFGRFINIRMKKSTIVNNPSMTSHSLRKSAAMRAYNSINKRENAASKAISQKKNSSALRPYITEIDS